MIFMGMLDHSGPQGGCTVIRGGGSVRAALYSGALPALYACSSLYAGETFARILRAGYIFHTFTVLIAQSGVNSIQFDRYRAARKG